MSDKTVNIEETEEPTTPKLPFWKQKPVQIAGAVLAAAGVVTAIYAKGRSDQSKKQTDEFGFDAPLAEDPIDETE